MLPLAIDIGNPSAEYTFVACQFFKDDIRYPMPYRSHLFIACRDNLASQFNLFHHIHQAKTSFDPI